MTGAMRPRSEVDRGSTRTITALRTVTDKECANGQNKDMLMPVSRVLYGGGGDMSGTSRKQKSRSRSPD